MKTHVAAKCRAEKPALCPYHGSTSVAAVNRQDINAFIEAKIQETQLSPTDLSLADIPSYPADFKSVRTVQLDGKVYDTTDLLESTSLNHYALDKIIYRPDASTGKKPTEEQKSLRLKATMFAEEVTSISEELRQKEFGKFASRKTKEAYYAGQLEKMQKAYKLSNEYTKKVLAAEGITKMTPEQKGDVFEWEAGGVKLYDEKYIFEHVNNNYAAQVLANTKTAVDNFHETTEWNYEPLRGTSAWG